MIVDVRLSRAGRELGARGQNAVYHRLAAELELATEGYEENHGVSCEWSIASDCSDSGIEIALADEDDEEEQSRARMVVAFVADNLEGDLDTLVESLEAES